ncbi:MAG: PD40 domain-containing protein [Deltaproteobacteria bacterium]|nr:PD40 domain-containing protein [Deltaproteobacteria bacterium]
MAGCSDEPMPGIQGAFEALAFVQRAHASHARSLLAPDDFRPGGRALLLEPVAPDGVLTVIAEPPGGDVRGLAISPDGERAIVAVRTGEADRFHLIEVDLEAARGGQPCFAESSDVGPACRQLTFGPFDDTRPFYLPDGRIAFSRADPRGQIEWQGRGRARVLMAVEPDGSRTSRIDFSPGHALGARLLPDGFVQLVRSTQRDGHAAFVPLRIDPSGARALEQDGPELDGGSLPLDPLRDEQDRLVAGCVPTAGTWLSGTICQRGTDGSWRTVLPGVPTGTGCSPEGRIRHPLPLGEERFLVAYAKTPNGCVTGADEMRGLVPDFALAVVEAGSGARYPLHNDSDRDDILPVPVRVRGLVDPGVTYPARPDAVCAQAGLIAEGQASPVQVVAVRALQGLSGAEAPWAVELGGQEPGAICAGEDGRTAALVQAAGDAPRAFRVRLPSGVPLKLQYLDRYGAAVESDPLWWGGPDCARRGELNAEMAVADLAAGAARQRDFDFRRDIQPVLNRSCVAAGCHDAGTSAGVYVGLDGRLRGLDLHEAASGRTSVAYHNLTLRDTLRDGAGRVLAEFRPWVVPGRARESRLVQRLGVPCRFGDCSSASWASWGMDFDDRHPEDQPSFTELVGAGELSAPSDEDRWTLVEWIDAGAPFHGRGAVP